MHNKISLESQKIVLDDLIKLAHVDIVDYLIKRSSEDANLAINSGILDPEKLADIIAEHYSKIFKDEFLKRYNDAVDERIKVSKSFKPNE